VVLRHFVLLSVVTVARVALAEEQALEVEAPAVERGRAARPIQVRLSVEWLYPHLPLTFLTGSISYTFDDQFDVGARYGFYASAKLPAVFGRWHPFRWTYLSLFVEPSVRYLLEDGAGTMLAGLGGGVELRAPSGLVGSLSVTVAWPFNGLYPIPFAAAEVGYAF